jgi:hypothetical protein
VYGSWGVQVKVFQSGGKACKKRIRRFCTREPVSCNIIYGIGMQGLSPFEFALAGKRAGDILNLHLRGEEIPTFFQHLFIPQLAILEGMNTFYLRVRVVDVSEPDEREIIKEMAEAASRSDSCCGH